MGLNQNQSDHDIAAGAFAIGFTTALSSLNVLGCYWWNLQMRLLSKIGVMGLFRARWWLLLLLGFLLLAFAMPLGVAYVFSAFCASSKNPKAENGYIVELGQATGAQRTSNDEDGQVANVSDGMADELPDLYIVAGLHHDNFIKEMDVHVDDIEFSAAALGALGGTVQALGAKASDVDMHSWGAAFIFKQLREQGRIGKVNPDWLAHVTVKAMSSADFDHIRKKAGHYAFAAVKAGG